MDRHLKWLRRRIIASVATQTAETFAVVAVVAFVVMYWRTSEGPLTSLFGAVVIAQLVAAARVGHAMRRNPLNYVFMRNYVDRPFSFRVSRFQGEDEAHPVAAKLSGFAPVATIRDSIADPEPIFDVYHDPSRLVAASVNRASGSIALISSLDDGRILVTSTRAKPPHERLVMSLADDDCVESVISTHRRAVSARCDVAELASSAHHVVLDSLALEYEAYTTLGPALRPFLDLERSGRSVLRLMARIETDELVDLPKRLGPDLPAPAQNPLPEAQQPPRTEAAEPQAVASDTKIHEFAAPIVAAPIVEPPIVAAPIVEPPIVAAPIVDAPQIALPVVTAAVPVVSQLVEPGTPIVEPVEQVVTEFVAFAGPAGPSISAAPAGTDAAVRIGLDAAVSVAPIEVGPTPFVTRYSDHADVDRPGEPVTADVPAVVFTSAVAPAGVASAVVVAPLPTFADSPPPVPATLAEAVVPAPDTAAMLNDGSVDYQVSAAPVSAMSAAGPPQLGADLADALGYNDEPVHSRPRLSAVLRADSAAESPAKRARRKQR